MNNIDLLLNNIKQAMESNPDLTLIETIDYVCDHTFSTRKYHGNKVLFDESEKWKLTNSDLLEAFIKYNIMRKNDNEYNKSV